MKVTGTASAEVEEAEEALSLVNEAMEKAVRKLASAQTPDEEGRSEVTVEVSIDDPNVEGTGK